MTIKFIGIDLDLKSQPSGLCCLEWIDGQLQLLNLDRKEAIADISPGSLRVYNRHLGKLIMRSLKPL